MSKKIIGIGLLILTVMSSCKQEEKVKITLDTSVNGTYNVTPKIPSDSLVKKGTVLTVEATPDKEYVFDSGYYTGPGPWGTMYYELMTPKFTVKATEETSIGVSFVKKEEQENLNVTQDIIYAKPGVKPLKYDVYAPKNAKNLPCVIIIHGGAWIANTEEVMRGLARTLANSQEYVVFSLDYRWIDTKDGDKTPTRMYQIIEDVYGGIAHIMENASKYGGDATTIFITGDSAGGHLSASAANFIERIGSNGFGKRNGVYEFLPTYLPEGMSLETFKSNLAKAVKGVVPSYPVLNPPLLKTFVKNEREEAIKALAPIFYIPDVKERAVPHLFFRGAKDDLISNDEVTSYQKALLKAGHTANYIEVAGAGHAFFDWKPEPKTKATFQKYGKPNAEKMLAFFENVLKEKRE